MTPDQFTVIDGHKVEEFYWAGKTVVYVDNQLVSTDYATTCDMLRNDKVPTLANPKQFTPTTT